LTVEEGTPKIHPVAARGSDPWDSDDDLPPSPFARVDLSGGATNPDDHSSGATPRTRNDDYRGSERVGIVGFVIDLITGLSK
jgi:hypothetical protein